MGKKGYKAFEKGMICKGKEYKENTTYEESGNDICESGVMHYCENPFDVLDYYPLVDDNGNFSEFAEVEALGNDLKKDNKSASNKLHIGAKLSFKNFIKACVDAGMDVSASVVTGFDKIHIVDADACEKIATSLGAKFRNREFITNGY